MQWFETTLGSYLLEREYRYFDKVVANIFGYNAIQISLPQFNFLRLNRMPLQFSISSEANHSSLMAEPAFLPIQSNSIDLVIMPHTLDFSANPHQILREVYRVLIPEGHVVMSGFNPFSLWGLARYLKVNRNTYPWNGNFNGANVFVLWRLPVIDGGLSAVGCIFYMPLSTCMACG